MSIRKLLVANRSEIAIRVFRAANELGLKTVAVYAEEDKLALHRFKADEAYLIGQGLGPIEAYLSIPEIIRVARDANVDAIHPGYGFLSESPDFAEACAAAGIVFIGPKPETMRRLGDKIAARNLAVAANVPVMPATPPLSDDIGEAKQAAVEIGYPVMLKASWGGGGRGMRVIRDEAALEKEIVAAKREAKAAFGRDEVYLEKLVERARHVEVQILGDSHGTIVHLNERDCTVQRRHQKVVERAPAPYLDAERRTELTEYALRIGHEADYMGAGTVEFLMDADTGAFYFIEVNPRIQVEHTVTEEVTGIDIVKAQIHVAEGAAIGTPESGVPTQDGIELNGHALQCRITTEDPEQNFIPDYGRITAYRGATGFGIRLDGGTAYSGAVITRFYDPLLEKVTAWAPTPEEAISRMDRALREFRIRGVATNLTFLENVIAHPAFQDTSYTTRFIDETPELFEQVARRDRATKLLTYIADVTVNGHPETRDRPKPPADARAPVAPVFEGNPPAGTKELLTELKPDGFSRWMREQKQVLVTDTTMRDAHQSLLATRMRSHDILGAADAYARGCCRNFSRLNAGAARRLTWPCGSSPRTLGSGSLNCASGFRIFSCRCCFAVRTASATLTIPTMWCGSLPSERRNPVLISSGSSTASTGSKTCAWRWMPCARPACCARAQSATPATFWMPTGRKYDLDYYTGLARELEAAGANIIGIKDMAGLLKPAAARQLIAALRDTTDLPIHFHTHDTSGIAAATVLAAVDAGVDAVDAALDSLSGLTSQPCLGSIIEALRGSERDTGLDANAIRQLSFYWEAVRKQYAAFEPDLRSGASEVYLHEMPGGQFTNLKEQARSLGLDSRWHDVAQTYSDVNEMFGDIVKVTPTSKVVGDMALMMVSQDLSVEDVLDTDTEVAFPDSVVQLMHGDLGQPVGGWPEGLQSKVLKGTEPLTVRPGSLLADADLEVERTTAAEAAGREIDDNDLASYLMYPKVFTEFAKAESLYGPVSVLPTPVYFYGLPAGEEIMVDLERGKTLVVRCQAVGETDEEGQVKVFFELNGQPRNVKVPDRAHGAGDAAARRKAEDDNPDHVAAPMPGVISTVNVKSGQKIKSGDVLLSIEAMKMETALHADRDGSIVEVIAQPGMQIDAKDLLLVLGE